MGEPSGFSLYNRLHNRKHRARIQPGKPGFFGKIASISRFQVGSARPGVPDLTAWVSGGDRCLPAVAAVSPW
jgi:hypothetical protein